MPAIGIDGDVEVVGGGEVTTEENGALKDRLVLLVIVLIIFHIGAFVCHILATTAF